MNLDDLTHLHTIDRDNMLGHIDALPDQFQQAWDLAHTLDLPASHQSPRQILLCGMGGSAIGGDLTAALIARTSPIPMLVQRGYDLPAYATGPDTLVILSSNSGNTEETLAAADEALGRGVRMLAMTTGGALADHAGAHGYPVWRFDYKSQPRAALGWSFGLLIGLADRLKLAPHLESDLAGAIALLREWKPRYTADTAAALNPAKRGAGQLVGRIPVILGAGIFEPVARRWKAQLNENSKIWAFYDPMPEANHNTVVGIDYPDKIKVSLLTIFIASPQFDHPRVWLRHDLTYRMCLESGIMTDKFQPEGDTALAQMLHAIQYGDYMSLYAAIAYDEDPTAIAPIVQLKEMLAQHT